MLEATIGLNEVEDAEQPAELAVPVGGAVGGEAGVFNANDLHFLQSLRITLTEEKTEAEGQNAPPGV